MMENTVTTSTDKNMPTLTSGHKRPLQQILETEKAVPAFLTKIYDILENAAYSEMVSWTPDGASFVINKPADFSNTVLPRYFKTNNFASFVRQLNMYDFHKTKQDSNWWEFHHPLFNRGQRQLLQNIKRKTSTESATKNDVQSQSKMEEDALLKEVLEIKQRHQITESQIQRLEEKNDILLRENEILWNERFAARQRQQAMHQRIQKIVYFLMSIFRANRGNKRRKLLMDSDSGEQDIEKWLNLIAHNDADTEVRPNSLQNQPALLQNTPFQMDHIPIELIDTPKLNTQPISVTPPTVGPLELNIPLNIEELGDPALSPSIGFGTSMDNISPVNIPLHNTIDAPELNERPISIHDYQSNVNSLNQNTQLKKLTPTTNNLNNIATTSTTTTATPIISSPLLSSTSPVNINTPTVVSPLIPNKIAQKSNASIIGNSSSNLPTLSNRSNATASLSPISASVSPMALKLNDIARLSSASTVNQNNSPANVINNSSNINPDDEIISNPNNINPPQHLSELSGTQLELSRDQEACLKKINDFENQLLFDSIDYDSGSYDDDELLDSVLLDQANHPQPNGQW